MAKSLGSRFLTLLKNCFPPFLSALTQENKGPERSAKLVINNNGDQSDIDFNGCDWNCQFFNR